MRYNARVPLLDEKEAARRATRQMKTAALVISLSFVLVLVLVAIILIVGRVRLF